MVSLFTIGHSTRSLEELVELLHLHRVELVVDVRSMPASRRMPHFGKASLERSLPQRGVDYVHLPSLGGLRKPAPNSANTGWRNVSFRGYADHMAGAEFREGVARLEDLAAKRRVVIMCAEAVPWRCHRSLISDALTVRGDEVRHITSAAEPALHALTPFALVTDGHITYPPPDTLPI